MTNSIPRLLRILLAQRTRQLRRIMEQRITDGLAMQTAESAALRNESELNEKLERATDGLQQIVSWSEAYPLDIFPEPDMKLAHKALKSVGLTLDAISASNMRHVVTRTGEIARNALKGVA